MSTPQYATPQALRAAVTDRLRTVADMRSTQLNDLLRQFAYDRFLARIFEDDPERWVLKGATAFRFEIAPGRPVAGPVATRQLTVTAYLGATVFASFPVDLVTDLNITGKPDVMGPHVNIDIPGIVPSRYRLYPVVDHIAHKVCAIHELHERMDAPPQPSTRYRDLADLSAFARTTVVEADTLLTALRSEAPRRRLTLPARVTVPAGGGWRTGYARVVRDVPAVVDRDITAATGTLRRFIDPVLDGSASGRWDPRGLTWIAGDSA